MICPICSKTNFVFFIKVKSHVIRKCQHCGLVALDHGLSSKQIHSQYRHNYFKNTVSGIGYLDYLKAEKGLRNTARQRISRLSKYLVPGIKLLDVGTGMGFFLSECKKSNITAEGVETSEEGVSYVKNTLHLPVTESSIEKYNPKKKFDVITAWDVIEHLPNQKFCLGKVSKLLKDNGYFIFSTGDISSFVARISGKYWHLYNLPDHLFFFSKKTIVSLLENNGFSVVSLSYPTASYTLGYLLERIARKFNFPGYRTLINITSKSNYIQNVTISVNLFDIMEVVAQKNSQ